MTRRRKILLADDSATIQKVVALTFSDEGIEVVAVGDGRSAVEYLEGSAAEPPDIVLADIHMPPPNGYELCERIKGDPRFQHIPVVLLIGTFEPFDEAEARRVGADDIVSKPFQSIRDLMGKIGSLFGGGDSSGARHEEDEPVTADLTPPPRSWTEPSVSESAASASSSGTRDAEADELPMASSAAEVSYNDIASDDELIEARTIETDDHAPTADAGFFNTDEGVAPIAAAPHTNMDQDREEKREVETSRATATTAQPSFASRMAGAAAADDALLDLGDLDDADSPSSSSGGDADDFELDLTDETPASARPASPAHPRATSVATASARPAAKDFGGESLAARVDSSSGDKPGGMMDIAVAAASRPDTAAAFAEAAHGESAAPESLSQIVADAPSSVAEISHSESGMTTGGARAGDASAGGQVNIGQLSPEMLDAIANRVVEQMSEKVIREIAWEVVPILSELLIKQRLDENK